MKTIQFLRREAGLTQIELANLMRIPRHQIQLHEQGLIPLPNSLKLKIMGTLEKVLRHESIQIEFPADALIEDLEANREK